MGTGGKLLLALALAWVGLRLAAALRGPRQGAAPHAYFAGSRPLVIAHRGASMFHPENTLPAFQAAVDAGSDILELDVWLTRDAVPVVIHDPTLDRTTNGAGSVEEHTREQLASLDAGHHFQLSGQDGYPYRGRGTRIPTLDDVLATWPGQRINIDIKDPDPIAAAAVMAVVRARGAGSTTLLTSFHRHVHIHLVDAWSPHPRGCDRPSITQLVILDWLGLGDLWRPQGDGLQVPPDYGGFPVATRSFLAAARRHGVPVHVWTLDDPEDWTRYRAWGVDGIMTNDPAGLRAWLGSTS